MKKIFTLMLAALGITVGTNAQTKYPEEVFKTPHGNEVTITLFTHASLGINYKGYQMYVDVVGKRGDMVIDYSGYPKADYLLVTHEHGDHFDPATLELLSKEGTPILLNAKSQGQLGKGLVIGNGEERTITADIQLDAVPAYNTTPGHLQYHPQGNGNGYILTIDGLRIYVAGDTEDIPEMTEIKNIDVAFLPVNQPFTMTVEQAINAASIIKPKVLIPYHFSQTDIKPIKEYFDKHADIGVEVRLRDMQ